MTVEYGQAIVLGGAVVVRLRAADRESTGVLLADLADVCDPAMSTAFRD